MPHLLLISTVCHSMPKYATLASHFHSLPQSATVCHSKPHLLLISTVCHSKPHLLLISTVCHSMPQYVTSASHFHSLPQYATVSHTCFSFPCSHSCHPPPTAQHSCSASWHQPHLRQLPLLLKLQEGVLDDVVHAGVFKVYLFFCCFLIPP